MQLGDSPLGDTIMRLLLSYTKRYNALQEFTRDILALVRQTSRRGILAWIYQEFNHMQP